jgi:hypothetical protein
MIDYLVKPPYGWVYFKDGSKEQVLLWESFGEMMSIFETVLGNVYVYKKIPFETEIGPLKLRKTIKLSQHQFYIAEPMYPVVDIPKTLRTYLDENNVFLRPIDIIDKIEVTETV